MSIVTNKIAATDIAIKVENLTKVYPLFDSPRYRFIEALHPFRKKYHHDFYALQDVSIEVNKGETVGIIGQNGCGKSTLLKILAQVLTPTSGNYFVNGKVSALLELGTGFNPELSGIENVCFSGTIMGITKVEMIKKLPEILAFADIGEYVYQPVKTYSSGMYVRLAFAVAINVDPDILIVDEALAVGDMRFQQKCYRKMHEFKKLNKTIVLVTHDTTAITSFCDHAIWLNKGKVFQTGIPNEVVKKYISFMGYGMETTDSDKILEKHETNNLKLLNNKDQLQSLEWQNVTGYSFFGEGGASIKEIALCREGENENIKILHGGEELCFYSHIIVNASINSPGFGILVKDRLGNDVFNVNNYMYSRTLRPLNAKEEVIIKTKFKFPHLFIGPYTISISLTDGNQEEHLQHHWIHDVILFNVENEKKSYHISRIIVIEDDNYEINLENE